MQQHLHPLLIKATRANHVPGAKVLQVQLRREIYPGKLVLRWWHFDYCRLMSTYLLTSRVAYASEILSCLPGFCFCGSRTSFDKTPRANKLLLAQSIGESPTLLNRLEARSAS